LALLKLLGCDYAQGFVLSKALPLEDLIKFLREAEAINPDSQCSKPSSRQGDTG